MDITITINTDNAAFDRGPGAEVARILRELSDRLPTTGRTLEALDDTRLRDINGNTVGRMRVT